MEKIIAAVVVTYNRKELLLNCLEALRYQTKKVDAIYIIDNLSDDGTPSLLLEKEYITDLPESNLQQNQKFHDRVKSLIDGRLIDLIYVRKAVNDGGAGGFYEGMKQAFDDGFEWIWLMDDDGIPDKNQIDNLFKMAGKFDLKYSNALVLNKDQKNELAFGLDSYSKIDDLPDTDLIYNKLNPFNGTFINREIPEKIGFIKKEMFIWGDEVEYTNRVKKAGYKVATVKSAIHYHPASKSSFKRIVPFLPFSVVIKPENRAAIFYRNLGFINYEYKRPAFYKLFIKYVFYFLIRGQIKGMRLFVNSYLNGAKNNF